MDGHSDPGAGEGEPAAVIELDATGYSGERLDRFLAGRLPQYSRTRLQRWIEMGAITWDDRVLDRRHRLAGVETILVDPQPLEADTAFEPEEVDFPVAFEDDSLLVIDKPAGLVVHPAAGNWRGTLLNGLLHRYASQKALPRAGIVHRLDKDTSGLMVVARSERAMAALSEQLSDRSMGRRYLALVQGAPGDRGVVEAPIGRDPVQRVRMAIVSGSAGRSARTSYRTLGQGRLGVRQVSLIECRLFTGRTHQIRVHMQHLGTPIVGDTLYGGLAVASCPRQALHAWRLALVHPQSGRHRTWTSPWPPSLADVLAEAGVGLDEAMSEATRGFDD